jgi:peptide/nickel transport system substrate-binding protein
LPRNALWSDGKTTINALDISSTLKLLQLDGASVGRSREWGKLLDVVESQRNPTQLTLRLKQGFLDPLALMTFKILPRDRMELQAVNRKEFAKNPVCSGPFRLDAERHSDEEGRECVFFVANPSYSLRSTKRGLPHIQEIRFYSYDNAVERLEHNKLDLVLDLTAQEAEELRQRSEKLNLEVATPSPMVPNRRIYFLAINNKKLKDKGLRKALAYAINREALLNTHFRGPLKGQIHKVLNGPFPVGSWACNPAITNRQRANSLDLFDEGRARDLSQQPAVREVVSEGGTWKLQYPEGDPALAEAMKALCAQVKELTGIVLEPTPCDPYKLREDVEETQIYHLAYYHYDFPDETYWLAPLLGAPSRAVKGTDDQNADPKENMFCFPLADLPVPLGEATKYRDFVTVRKNMWALHEWLLSEMPFIPLWQLDPLLAHQRAVKPGVIDPLLVFSDIENWRLKRGK